MRLTSSLPQRRRPGDPAAGPGRRVVAVRRLPAWAGRCLFVIALAVVVSVLLTSAASAQAAGPVQELALADSVDTVLNNLRNWIMGILAALATLFLTIGGVRYIMANGDPGEVEKAKTSFKSAGWGYALAALAPLVVQILKGIVGA